MSGWRAWAAWLGVMGLIWLADAMLWLMGALFISEPWADRWADALIQRFLAGVLVLAVVWEDRP